MCEDIGMAQITAELLKDRFGLTVESVFVPFSKSRHKDEKSKSLNWRVTLKKDGRDIITTDYSAGIGHCPSYKNHNSRIHGCKNSLLHDRFITHEVEKGTEAQDMPTFGAVLGRKNKPILPDAANVVYSLLMDSDAIEHATFEDWADSTGYDSDSRQAEAIYRACLETGLRLRSGLGDTVLSLLRELFQDY